MRGLAFVIVLLLLVCPLVAPAQESRTQLRNRYRITAAVSDDLSRIEGRVEVDVVNDRDEAIDTLALWLYPNLYEGPLPGVSDVNRDLYSPYGEGKGGIDLGPVAVADEPLEPIPVELPDAPVKTVAALKLARPLQPGERVLVAAEFTTRVPHRLGPLSNAHGVLTALGGWHPYVVAGDPADVPAIARRPRAADWYIDLRIPKKHVALIGGELSKGGVVRLEHREWVDLAVRHSWIRPLRTQGGAVWPLKPEEDRSWGHTALPDPPPPPSAYVADEIRDLLEELDEWADGRDEIPDPGPIDLVIAPIRSEVAVFTPGVVAVSDYAYEITPVGPLLRFHARGIARAWLARRFLPIVRRCEEPAMVPQVADALGAWYAERFVEEVGGTPDARNLLGAFDFLPSIDDFLRSPKSAFAHTYFLPVADPIVVRDEPWTFNNEAPRGKLLLEKMRDWLRSPGLADVIATYVAAAKDHGSCPSLQDVAEAQTSEELDAFFDTWTRSMPREDLRIDILSSGKAKEGGYRNRVRLWRVGDTPHEVIEAVTYDEDGHLHPIRWEARDGEAEKVFTLLTSSPLETARIDPRGRVAQYPAKPGEVSAIGDRDPAPIQLLVTRVAISYSTADATFYGAADILLRPREAVHRRLGFGASYRKSEISARSTLSLGFGPLIDAARYAYNGSVGLTASYLRPGFGSEEASGGYAIGPFVGLLYDDRPPALSPLRGTAYGLGGAIYLGTGVEDGTSVYGTLSGAWIRLLPIGSRQSLALRLKAATVVGPAPVQQQVALGGSEDVRGFPLEEVLGKHRAILSVEYRHPFLPDTDVDLFFGRLREVSGAVFADGAAMGEIFQRLPGWPSEAVFGDVGYGLRFQYDLFGLRPALLSVDVATPIGRLPGIDDPPVTFVIRAGQAFGSP